MVFGRVSGTIAKFPAATLVIILIISGIMTAVMVTRTDFRTDEEDFAPDSDIARANDFVNDNYAQDAYFVQVIAEAGAGDILTKESMMDMLEYEQAVLEDDAVSDKIQPTASAPAGINSAADLVLVLNTLHTGLDQIHAGLDLMNATLGEVIDNLTLFIFFLQTQISDDNLLEMAPSIFGYSEMFMPDPDAPDPFQQPPEDNRTSIERMEALSTQDIKQLVFDTINFDKSAQGRKLLDHNGLVEEQMQSLNSSKFLLLETVNIIKSYPNASVIVQDNQSLGEILDLMVLGLFAQEADTSFFTSKAYAVFDYIEFMAEIFPQLLSKDFNRGAGDPSDLEAESCLILIQLKSSLVDVDDNERIREAETRIYELAKEENEYSETEMRVLGMVLMNDQISEGALGEMMMLISISLALLLIILAITYRSVIDMAISFTAILMAISWTFGFAAIMDWPFNTIMTAVPILIIGLGIDYGIHLTLRYKEEKQHNGKGTKEAVRIAVFFVGSALALATFTTCMGFLSNYTSEMALIRRFGILAAVGIVSSFIIMITFVPSLKQLIDRFREGNEEGPGGEEPSHKGAKKAPSRKASIKGPGGRSGGGARKSTGSANAFENAVAPLGRGLISFVGLGAVLARRSSVGVIIVALLITGISLFGAAQLETRFEFEDFLPERSESATNFKYALDHFEFSLDQSYVLVKGDNVADARVLAAVDETSVNMLDDEFVDSTNIFSAAALIRDVSTDERSARPADLYDEEFAQMVRGNTTGNDTLPSGHIQEIFEWLYTDPLTESEAKRALHVRDESAAFLRFDGLLISVGVTTSIVEDGDDIQRDLEKDHRPLKELVDDGVIDESTVTGGLVVTKATMDAMTRSQYRSIALTIGVSAAILTVVFFIEKRSLVLGVLTTIPIAFVISWVLGGMFLFGFKLNVLTITVGALTVGLGVTYAIHITHRFVEEIDKQQDVDRALEVCLKSTGGALFGAAATTVGGFAILRFSTLPPMQQFGPIAAMAITFSMVASIFVLPSILRVWARIREDRGTLFKYGDEDLVEAVEVLDD